MTWKPEIEELKRREALAHQMGGKDKVARQHDFGKLTIRERIDAIIDPESLHEIGAHRLRYPPRIRTSTAGPGPRTAAASSRASSISLRRFICRSSI